MNLESNIAVMKCSTKLGKNKIVTFGQLFDFCSLCVFWLRPVAIKRVIQSSKINRALLCGLLIVCGEISRLISLCY